MKTVLVTGGAGFIGSALVRHLIWHSDYRVVVFDKLTYAGNLASLASVTDHPRYVFEKGDICNLREVKNVIIEFQPDAIVHLAAETHVDRSIESPGVFIETNIVGSSVLLEAARGYWNERDDKASFRFHQVSTDEVCGSLGKTGRFTEDSPYHSSSPYSASRCATGCMLKIMPGPCSWSWRRVPSARPTMSVGDAI